MKGQEMRMHEK